VRLFSGVVSAAEKRAVWPESGVPGNNGFSAVAAEPARHNGHGRKVAPSLSKKVRIPFRGYAAMKDSSLALHISCNSERLFLLEGSEDKHHKLERKRENNENEIKSDKSNCEFALQAESMDDRPVCNRPGGVPRHRDINVARPTSGVPCH
jgi:hypothetical protein